MIKSAARDNAINDTNNLKSLIDALNHFYKQTKTKSLLSTSFSIISMIAFKDADELIKFTVRFRQTSSNIIEYKPHWLYTL